MEFVKINFTPNRLKYLLFEEIKDALFKNNGIIFGGFVRDMIISNYYKDIYNIINKNRCNIHNFWNKFYQPETAPRTLVAEDMDICMYTEEDVSNFLIAIGEIFNGNGGYANVSSSDITVTRDTSYFCIPIKMHKKINYKITVGRIPYVHNGVEISFDFDIIIPKYSNIQPPFFKIDFLSNIFILSKNGIVMSNNTGTIIDKMSILNKQKFSSIIMKDIVEFKTQFCMRSYADNNYTCGDYSYNCEVFERINKMVFRHFKWNIENLPFMICNYTHDNNNNNCCICLSELKNKERVVKVYINNSTNTGRIYSVAHDNCMFKYFKTQLETSESEEITNTDIFQFKCPMRNVLNFKLCSENINDLIKKKLM
jgi:hypothetical protein